MIMTNGSSVNGGKKTANEFIIFVAAESWIGLGR
jgi:hypothetical protein